MNRTLIRFASFCVILLCVILLMEIPLDTKAFNNENDKITSTQNETEEKAVGNLPEANVTLYAIEREGYLGNFQLEANGVIQHFPYWINVSNPAYWPQLFYNDINQDGKKELVVILTREYGTGLINQDIHVLHENKTNLGNVYKEVLVDNPISILLKNVKTKLTKSEAIINIGNEKTDIKIDQFGINPKQLFSDIVTENLVRYEVLDNELTAIIGAQISPVGGYIGSFHITYEYKNGMYEVKRIEFIQDEDL